MYLPIIDIKHLVPEIVYILLGDDTGDGNTTSPTTRLSQMLPTPSFQLSGVLSSGIWP